MSRWEAGVREAVPGIGNSRSQGLGAEQSPLCAESPGRPGPRMVVPRASSLPGLDSLLHSPPPPGTPGLGLTQSLAFVRLDGHQWELRGMGLMKCFRQLLVRQEVVVCGLQEGPGIFLYFIIRLASFVGGGRGSCANGGTHRGSGSVTI